MQRLEIQQRKTRQAENELAALEIERDNALKVATLEARDVGDVLDACWALLRCRSTDQDKAIRDVAAAMHAYYEGREVAA